MTGMVIVVPAIAAVLAAGALVNHVTLAPGRWISIIILLWAGTIPFTLFGLGNGYSAPTRCTATGGPAARHERRSRDDAPSGTG